MVCVCSLRRWSSFPPQQPPQCCALCWWPEGCWWQTQVLAGAEQHWHSISAASPALLSHWGLGKILGGDRARTVDSNQYFIPYDIWSTKTPKRRGQRRQGDGKAFIIITPVFQNNCCPEVLLHRKWPLFLPYSTAFTFTHKLFSILFSPLSLSAEGSGRLAPGIQPGSIQHITRNRSELPYCQCWSS